MRRSMRSGSAMTRLFIMVLMYLTSSQAASTCDPRACCCARGALVTETQTSGVLALELEIEGLPQLECPRKVELVCRVQPDLLACVGLEPGSGQSFTVTPALVPGGDGFRFTTPCTVIEDDGELTEHEVESEVVCDKDSGCSANVLPGSYSAGMLYDSAGSRSPLFGGYKFMCYTRKLLTCVHY